MNNLFNMTLWKQLYHETLSDASDHFPTYENDQIEKNKIESVNHDGGQRKPCSVCSAPHVDRKKEKEKEKADNGEAEKEDGENEKEKPKPKTGGECVWNSDIYARTSMESGYQYVHCTMVQNRLISQNL